jgi:hypothetical protein
MRRRISHVEQRRYGWRDAWRDLVPLFVVILLAFLLHDLEIRDRNAQRATAYRLCTRNKDDRAYAHARERGLAIKKSDGSWIPARPMTAAERRRARDNSRVLMETPLLPILDCAPNARGHGAKPLPLAKQESYMNRWRLRGLAPAEYGVCPGSMIGDTAPADRC